MAIPGRIAFQAIRRMSAHANDTAAVEAGRKRWVMITWCIGMPLTTIGIANILYETFILKHKHERPEFIKYDHLRLRTKPFPWKDGVKSLFHNPHTNALPDGYEDEH